MNYLLDTHVLLWISNNDRRLGKTFRGKFANSKFDFSVSIVSIWEMAIKMSLNKLVLPIGLQQFVETEVVGNGIRILEFKAVHCYCLQNLPFHHRDPFDRAIIAQAITEKFVLVTKDEHVKHYKVKTLKP